MSDATIEHPKSDHGPALALIVATLLWGIGFTFAKAAGEAVNHMSGAGDKAGVGPIWVLVARFFLAGICWLLLFKHARCGWNLKLIWRSIILCLPSWRNRMKAAE